MPETTSPTARPRTVAGSRLSRASSILVTGLVGLLVLFLFTATFGGVSGTEFTPEAIATRSFIYYEIPLVHLQVWPITRRDRSHTLHAAIRALVPPATAAPRWDLVDFSRSGSLVNQGDARILNQYLTAVDSSGGFYWEAWTVSHPVEAKIVWPAIIKVARQRLYTFIPDIFALTDQQYQPPQLQRELDLLLGRNYRQMAEIQRRNGNTQFAAQLLSEAAQYPTVAEQEP